jgi:hypothetical protein
MEIERIKGINEGEEERAIDVSKHTIDMNVNVIMKPYYVQYMPVKKKCNAHSVLLCRLNLLF